MKTVLWIALFVGALIVGTWLVGIRVFVVQPIGAVPNGVTAIVFGARGLHFIDSPDAFCMRQQGYVNLLCRGVAVAGVAKNATILLRLPYSEWLYALSGAPEVDQ